MSEEAGGEVNLRVDAHVAFFVGEGQPVVQSHLLDDRTEVGDVVISARLCVGAMLVLPWPTFCRSLMGRCNETASV